jgi:hypothetical protein
LAIPLPGVDQERSVNQRGRLIPAADVGVRFATAIPCANQGISPAFNGWEEKKAFMAGRGVSAT